MKLKEFNFNELKQPYYSGVGLAIRMGDSPYYEGFIGEVLDKIPIEWVEAEIETTRWYFNQFIIILKEVNNKNGES